MRPTQFPFLATTITALGIACGLNACSSNPSAKETAGTGANSGQSTQIQPPTVEEGRKKLGELAAQSCQKNVKGKSFEEFEKQVFKEQRPNGKYIVNGDTTIANRKQLREFYDKFKNCVEPHRESMPNGLIVSHLNGADMIWNSLDRKALSYCVSTQFGINKPEVEKAMQAATAAWEAVADVKFIHDTSQDGKCDDENAKVLFNVNPVEVNGEYLARAFFPNEPRVQRNVLIDSSAFQIDPQGKLSLVGILRHELGHALGFRHEQTRPEAGTCFEDSDWRPLNNYDAFSVMHYPQCNGKGDWSLQLTESDKQGAACLYGATPGFQLDLRTCLRTSPGEPSLEGVKKTELFSRQGIRQSEEKIYGPFSVEPNTLATITMTGNRRAGDPDLFVRFGDKPDRASQQYSCRPYLPGADEQCALDVPSVARELYVMVYGFSAANYSLKVEYVKSK